MGNNLLKSDKAKSKHNQKNRLISFCLFINVLLISLLSNSALYAQNATSVAVVNVTFLMENAPQSEAASNLLKEKFLPQEERLAKQLETINKLKTELENLISSGVKGEIKRQKERLLRSEKRKRSRSLQDFREELRFARDAALDDVQKEVFNAIDAVRDQQNIDIVLQDYISASKTIDITPLVLTYLKKQLERMSQSEKVK